MEEPATWRMTHDEAKKKLDALAKPADIYAQFAKRRLILAEDVFRDTQKAYLGAKKDLGRRGTRATETECRRIRGDLQRDAEIVTHWQDRVAQEYKASLLEKINAVNPQKYPQVLEILGTDGNSLPVLEEIEKLETLLCRFEYKQAEEL